MITPWTDVEHGRVSYFSVRPGYASTIHKVQGEEFKHITIWLDVPNMPAAGYTAISRRKREQLQTRGGHNATALRPGDAQMSMSPKPCSLTAALPRVEDSVMI
jgi:hypothetical protein